MKRQLLVSILVLVLSLPSFAVTIDVWLQHTNEEMKILREITDKFTEKTSIEVNYTYVNPADSETVFLMAAASGTAYDVGGVGSLFAPDLGLRGAVINLAQFPDYEEFAANFPPMYFNSLQYQGLVFGIPYRSYLYLTYQRTDILQDLGIAPVTTWTELKSILPRLQAQGMNFALTFGISESVYADVNMFMWQYGGDDYNEDLTKSGYDSPESIAGFKEFAEIYTQYKIPQQVVAYQSFTQGELPILMQSGHFATNLEVSAPQLAGKWQMTPAIGTMRDGELHIESFIGGVALVISKDSKNPQAAWEYIKWLCSVETQTEITTRLAQQIRGNLFIPANSEAIGNMPVGEENALTLRKQAEGSRASMYGLVAPRLRRRYLQFAAEEVVLLGRDPEEAIRKAAADHNEEIRKKTIEYDRFIKRMLEEAGKAK